MICSVELCAMIGNSTSSSHPLCYGSHAYKCQFISSLLMAPHLLFVIKRMTNTIVAKFELHLYALEREKSGTAVCESSGLSSYGARDSALDWSYTIRSFLLHQQGGQDALFSPDLCRRGGRVVGSSRAQTPHT